MGLRVIIPVAGMGTRMKPHTHTMPKVLIQVAGKPMIAHILDELKKYDIDEVTLVVGHLGEAIENYVTKAYDYKFQFVEQTEQKGLGHAIWMTGELYRDVESPLLVILGDTIFDANFKSIIGSDSNWIGVKEVADARRFGVVELEGDRIVRMLEKPEHPPTNLAVVGIYYFTDGRTLFSCLDEVISHNIKTQGEFQLTDALQLMLERGAVLRPFVIDGWYDCGKPETHLETNRNLLTLYEKRGEAAPAPEFEGALIRRPVSIGKDVTIENSIVGPYVTVADGAVVRNSIVSDSILSANAVIENILLSDSIIADNAVASGQVYHLNVGDASEIKLS